ncbi:MAG: DUF4256 domain-containing protein [Patescibacteria group bacterium]
MTVVAEQSKLADADTLQTLQQHLSAEMQRHTEAVAAIQQEMQNATREDARSLIEGDSEAATGEQKSSEPVAEQKRELSPEETRDMLALLERRLSQKPDHYTRPEGISFGDVRKSLEADPAALWSIWKMEETGGAPDITAVENDAFIFEDCSKESPAGRRNCVYDKGAEKFASGTFNGNAVDMAKEFGIKILSPEEYRRLQTVGKFDRNTWSWVETDAETRSSGVALDGDRNGDHVYVCRGIARFHCGDRAWRGLLRVQKVS